MSWIIYDYLHFENLALPLWNEACVLFIMTSLFGISLFCFYFFLILFKCIKSLECRLSFIQTSTNLSNVQPSRLPLLHHHLLLLHCRYICDIKWALCHDKCITWNYWHLQWSEDVPLFAFLTHYLLCTRSVPCLCKGDMCLQ